MDSSKGKQILRLALPLILQQLCLQLQIWIDRAMLGHVNALFFSAILAVLIAVSVELEPVPIMTARLTSSFHLPRYSLSRNEPSEKPSISCGPPGNRADRT